MRRAKLIAMMRTFHGLVFQREGILCVQNDMNSKPIFERAGPSLANKKVPLQTVTNRFTPFQPVTTRRRGGISLASDPRASVLECPESFRGFRTGEMLPNSMASRALKSAVVSALCRRTPQAGGHSFASDFSNMPPQLHGRTKASSHCVIL